MYIKNKHKQILIYSLNLALEQAPCASLRNWILEIKQEIGEN